MTERSERAQRRRESWVGEVTEPGTAEPALYDGLSAEERLAAFAALNARAWTTAGLLPLPPLPRSEWPGCVFFMPRQDG
ncbi:MAG: hypothetical protein H6698_02200 [Myxococcales bacterium]|nr:hypothetical protein [Myxococcales bacterium]MCB9532513.1 hypothetical protein [Myxococcales bacterium]MCB9533123.1 hypothetical protein [Myxococcales bacterium]